MLAGIVFPAGPVDGDVTGLIPGYAGMERGDIIQTLGNGVPGPAHVVEQDEITSRPIEMVFKKDFFQNLGTDAVTMEYVVTDRAGNASITSMPVIVDIKY